MVGGPVTRKVMPGNHATAWGHTATWVYITGNVGWMCVAAAMVAAIDLGPMAQRQKKKRAMRSQR